MEIEGETDRDKRDGLMAKYMMILDSLSVIILNA